MLGLFKGIIRTPSWNHHGIRRIQFEPLRNRSTLIGAFVPSQSRSYVQLHDFNVLQDGMEHDTVLPSFMVGYKNGFLPRQV